MSISAFDFEDYKKFILAKLESFPGNEKVNLTQAANALDVHSSLFSRVFKGESDLSEEQAFALAQFLGLSPEELAYFMSQVGHARAGTVDLKNYYQKQMLDMKVAHGTKIMDSLSSAQPKQHVLELIFGSNTTMQIHGVTGLKGVNTIEKVAKRLKLETSIVEDTMRQLISADLIENTTEGLRSKENTFVLSKGALNLYYRKQCRMVAMKNMANKEPDELSLSSIMPIKKENLVKIRQRFIEVVTELQEHYDANDADTVSIINIDLTQI